MCKRIYIFKRPNFAEEPQQIPAIQQANFMSKQWKEKVITFTYFQVELVRVGCTGAAAVKLYYKIHVANRKPN